MKLTMLFKKLTAGKKAEVKKLPLDSYFITDIETQTLFLHPCGIDEETGDFMYFLKDEKIGACVFQQKAAKQLLKLTEKEFLLMPIQCNSVS